MFRHLALLLLICIGYSSQAQTNVTKNVNAQKGDTLVYNDANMLGTFQIIHHTKQREILTVSWYAEIEARRHETEVVMWDISPLTTIRIFPRSLVKAPMNYRVPQHEIILIEENDDKKGDGK